MSFTLPFDLQHWYVDVLAGNTLIFVALLLIAIGYISAIFRFTDRIGMVFFALGILMLAPIMPEFYGLAVVIIAVYVGIIIARAQK